MDKVYRITGRLIGEDKKPAEGVKVKVYDKDGTFLASDFADKDGKVDFECAAKPTFAKFVHKDRTLLTKDLASIEDVFVDFGEIVLCIIPPKDWHLKGVVRDKMTGDPLEGLRVQAFDKDYPAKDYLGEDYTDASGRFDIWFDDQDFDLGMEFGGPDIFFKVMLDSIELLETEVDWNVTGIHQNCAYCWHKGKTYTLEVDYVTALINEVGPVPTIDINGLGLASYGGISDRPFGGRTTIGGRIWGAKVDKWRLSYAAGVVDSGDSPPTGLSPSAADPFNTIAEGANKVWDGPIAVWDTGTLEGLHTVILIVWDDAGNEFHDVQLVCLHNEAINPPAQISSPGPCSTVSKGDGGSVTVEGTAADGISPSYDYFRTYALLWAGCGQIASSSAQKELTGAGITYPASPVTPVVNGILGTWDISGLKDGPYVLRLAVHDRTILNDGHHTISDWTWNTVNIVSG